MSEQTDGATSAHVLLLDDEVSVTQAVAQILQQAGYSTAIANDCDTALQKLNERPPDLILSDVNMPCQNGLDFLRRLRLDVRTVRVPVVLVSAMARPEDREAGLKAGAVAYVFKPIDPTHLLEVVTRVLAERTLEKPKPTPALKTSPT